MRLTDTHCHFDFPPFIGDEEKSVARAAEVGIERIIVPAVDVSRFAHIVALDAHLDQLESWLWQKSAKLMAIGEIGLDVYMDNPRFARQEFLLDAQLQLAKQYDLPRR